MSPSYQDSYQGGGMQFGFGPIGPAVRWLLGLNIAIFILCLSQPLKTFLYSWFALFTDVVFPWQWITYTFLHLDIGHLFSNMLGVFFFGAMLEQNFQTQRFLRYYFFCGLGGAFFSYLFHLSGGGTQVVLGASGALYGILYGCYRVAPNMRVYVMGVFPLSIKALLLIYGGIDFLMLLQGGTGIAHYAHLGGLAAGWVYFRWRPAIENFSIPLPKMKKIRFGGSANKPAQTRVEDLGEMPKSTPDSERLDQILSKISTQGMGALTTEEKRFLSQMSKRRTGRG